MKEGSSSTRCRLPWKCMRVVRGWSAKTKARWGPGQIAPSTPRKRTWDASSLSPHPDGLCPGCSPSHLTLTFPVWDLPQKQEVCFQYFAKFYLKMLKLTSHKIRIFHHKEKRNPTKIYITAHKGRGGGRARLSRGAGGRLEGRVEAVAERDRRAKGEQERSRESETVGGEREPGGRPWYRTRVGKGKTVGEGRQQEKRSREPAAGEGRGPLSMVLPGWGQDYSRTLAGMQLGDWSWTQDFCAAGLSSKAVPQM